MKPNRKLKKVNKEEIKKTAEKQLYRHPTKCKCKRCQWAERIINSMEKTNFKNDLERKLKVNPQ